MREHMDLIQLAHNRVLWGSHVNSNKLLSSYKKEVLIGQATMDSRLCSIWSTYESSVHEKRYFRSVSQETPSGYPSMIWTTDHYNGQGTEMGVEIFTQETETHCGLRPISYTTGWVIIYFYKTVNPLLVYQYTRYHWNCTTWQKQGKQRQ